MAQFLVESTITVVIALLIAVAITWLILPFFNNVAGKSIQVNELLSPEIFTVIIVLPIVVGLLAGSYPAFFITRIRISF